MAGAGYRDWTAGEKPTADQFDTYLQQQTIMRFASASARNSALAAVLAEGMMAWLDDLNVMTVYSGSAWSTIGPVHGAGTSWTPTVTQSGSVAVTVTRAVYWRVGRLVTCAMKVVCSGTGTASNAFVIGGLPVAALTTVGSNGTGFVYDASANLYYQGTAALITSTTLQLYTTQNSSATPGLGIAGFTAALTTNDEIHATFTYEAAGDA